MLESAILSPSLPRAAPSHRPCDNGLEDIVLATPAPAARLAPRPSRPGPNFHHHQHHSSDPSPQTWRAPGPVLISSSANTRLFDNNNHNKQAQSFCRDFEIPPLLTRGTSFGGLPCSDSTRQRAQPSSDFIPTLTGDTAGVIKVEDRGGKLNEWFKGSSAPINFGIKTATTTTAGSTLNPSKMESSATSEKHSSRPYAHKRSSTLQSISSFLGGGAGNSKRESASPRAALASIPAPADDEFLNLDINTALFPNGSSDPAASPHAFRDLVSNAEATILRIQTAYKLRTMALHDISAEKSAQADELEESQTRARHLKMQLDDLSAKVSEQERTMKELAEELSAERQRRYEEEEARKRTITLVKKPASIPMDGGDNNDNKTLAATKRISRASDSGFESEDESCAESVFSRVHDRADAASPAGTMFTSASGLTSPVELVSSSAPFPLFSSSSPSVQKPPNEHAEDKPDDPSVTPTQRSSIPPQRSSAFQKMLRGIGATSMAKAAEAGLGGCANCRGEDASMAWNIVGHLREENAELNTRVGQLEGAVENCLDIVKGLHV